MGNLEAEGLGDRTRLVGDVMTDVLLRTAERVRRDPVASPVSDDEPYVLATIHRADNTDDPDRLRAIIDALAGCDDAVYLPVHPRLRARCIEFGIEPSLGSIRAVEPMGYPQLVQALATARGVVTDSGGLQKEAFLLGVPVHGPHRNRVGGDTRNGWNVLVADPKDLPEALARTRPSVKRGSPYGDGHAADHVIDALSTWR